MSLRYKGAVISATPPTVSATSPNNYGTAKGVWTLQQQLQYEGAGTWPSPFTPVYIEDVFSTYLYTGNGSTQTITNGIDLSGKGGLVWGKSRDLVADNVLVDSARGVANTLVTNSTGAQNAIATAAISSFNSNGFSFSGNSDLNASPYIYASWTFRKQPKFFDVVTYTGNGSNRTISHNLGSVPGCMIIKSISGTNAGIYSWAVYHRSLNASGLGPQGSYIFLNDTSAQSAGSDYWNSTNPTSTQFSLGSNGSVNNNGTSYIAYLFAHDAGGFGDAGDQSVISCGSWTGTGVSPGPTINLGWEPQFILYKRASGGTGDWGIHDNMRGLGVGTSSTSGSGNRLEPNTSDAETGASNFANISATGFTVTSTAADINANGNTYIYIAIRRGPMKTPTSGTSVFDMLMDSGTAAQRTVTLTNTPDLIISRARSGSNPTIYGRQNWLDRLRGKNRFLESVNTDAENSTYTDINDFAANKGTIIGADQNWAAINYSSEYPYARYFFQRAPGFFDVVCYTGTGSAGSKSHNLGVIPEWIITKSRSQAGEQWWVYSSSIGTGKCILLSSNGASLTDTRYINATPTSTTFTINSGDFAVNASNVTYVSYLFASVTGVSKVGSYTGTGTTLQVNCGFTGGARFVLIKRTDSTGDWYVWDSARGIVAGNDPYLLLNSTAAEVTNTDYVDTFSSGFEISSTAPAAINANGGTFIFLAIA